MLRGMAFTDTIEKLVTVDELAIWTQTEIAADDFAANAILAAASLIVRTEAEQPLWTAADAPPMAKLITVQLAKRTYLNPNAVISEGSIGPIGGDRFLEDFVRTLELTSVEIAQLRAMRPDTTSGVAGHTRGLWSQPTTRGPVEKPVHLPSTPPLSDWGILVASADESWMYE